MKARHLPRTASPKLPLAQATPTRVLDQEIVAPPGTPPSCGLEGHFYLIGGGVGGVASIRIRRGSSVRSPQPPATGLRGQSPDPSPAPGRGSHRVAGRVRTGSHGRGRCCSGTWDRKVAPELRAVDSSGDNSSSHSGMPPPVPGAWTRLEQKVGGNIVAEGIETAANGDTLVRRFDTDYRDLSEAI